MIDTFVKCKTCGHTEDQQTAEEGWAQDILTGEWICFECWIEDDDEEEP